MGYVNAIPWLQVMMRFFGLSRLLNLSNFSDVAEIRCASTIGLDRLMSAQIGRAPGYTTDKTRIAGYNAEHEYR